MSTKPRDRLLDPFRSSRRTLWDWRSNFSANESPNALAEVNIPDSILQNTVAGYALHAGKRKRLSTCSGVAWIPGTHQFITINMLNETLNGFEWEEKDNRIKHLWTLCSKDSMGLHLAEIVAISKLNSLLAISNTGTGLVQLFELSIFLNSKPPLQPKPIHTLKDFQDPFCHGVSFNTKGDICAITTVGNPGSIRFYKVRRSDSGSGLDISHLQDIANTESPLKPKSVAFSPCGQWVAIGYCRRIGKRPGKAHGIIKIHKWDEQKDALTPYPQDTFSGISSVETLVFSHKNIIYCTDQANDRITAHAINPSNGKILKNFIFCHGENANLKFPHGLAISTDRKYMAITCYGDDKVSIFGL